MRRQLFLLMANLGYLSLHVVIRMFAVITGENKTLAITLADGKFITENCNERENFICIFPVRQHMTLKTLDHNEKVCDKRSGNFSSPRNVKTTAFHS